MLFVKVALSLKSCTPFSILLVIIPSTTSFVASYTRPLGRLKGVLASPEPSIPVKDQPFSAAAAVTPNRDLIPGM